MQKLSNEEKENAMDIHRRAIVIDGLNASAFDQKRLEKARWAGVTASNVTVDYSPPSYLFPESGRFLDVAKSISNWYSLLDKNRDAASLVTKVSDIETCKQQQKTGIILGLQSAACLEDDLGRHVLRNDLSRLLILEKLGIRVVQLAYFKRNLFGDGCIERTDCGLSEYGVDLVEDMNSLGTVVDLSHCGRMTTMDAIEISKDPVLFTHANPYSLCNNPRNKTDDMFKAIAEKDGVAGISSVSSFCYRMENVRPTMEDYLDHVDYLVKLIGVDHVSIGLDLTEGQWTKERYDAEARPVGGIVRFDLETSYVEGLETISGFPRITLGLVARGYSSDEIVKILGNNLLRVFRKVWRE